MSTKRKVYTFYIISILVMVLVLMLCNLNIMAKAIVGLISPEDSSNLQMALLLVG